MDDREVGWLGTGRMGSAMARRLIDSGCSVTVWNRTRSKADVLGAAGAQVAGTAADLGRAEIVFVMVSTPADLEQVVNDPHGLLSGPALPKLLVDCSTVDVDASAKVRRELALRGVDFLAAPVSGNPHVVAEGDAVLVASGPRAVFDQAEPYLRAIGRAAVWVGEQEQARLVKICHNLYLGLIAQAVSEVTTLAEKAGVPRAAFLDFLSHTVLATEWVRRRTPDMLSLDWTPTFTTELLRKDFDLGMAAARAEEVPMPLAAATHQLIQRAIGLGHRDDDFLSLFQMQAEASGMKLEAR
jgi:3-hydroxyisobutyrate dehydrogenase-like beta-hydroxyacid dehydrogenase